MTTKDKTLKERIKDPVEALKEFQKLPKVTKSIPKIKKEIHEEAFRNVKHGIDKEINTRNVFGADKRLKKWKESEDRAKFRSRITHAHLKRLKT